MRHPFGAWLEAEDLDVSSRALFNEALLCYSAGAYRAALVFSYLGLLRLVGHRLMASLPPSGFPEALWQQVQRDLREDQKWETTAYDNLVRTYLFTAPGVGWEHRVFMTERLALSLESWPNLLR